MSRWSTADEVFAYLESFVNLERGAFNPREYRLERMDQILRYFGSPHKAYRVIHVAGSKGKGSVCAFTAACCVAAGERVGLYMSPHVSNYRERIGLLGFSVTPAEYDAYVMECGERIAAYIDGLRQDGQQETLPTTFELLTLLGFMVFEAAGCTLGVIEVGLGGRLDATNLVAPEVAVITGIELEHTDYLGETIDSIAREKGGIIKPGVPVVIADQPPEAREVLGRIATERNAPVTWYRDSVTTNVGTTTELGTEVHFALTDGLELTVRLRLLGAVQALNAALAVLAIRTVFPDITKETLIAGLSSAWLPGRAELRPGTPRILMDGAHTPESVRTVMRIAAELQPDSELRVLIFGSVTGKRHRMMLQTLAGQFQRIIISKPGTFKESNTEELFSICREVEPNSMWLDEMQDALRTARELLEGHPDGLILVTGSFHLVGQARRVLAAEGQRDGITAD